jgi:hypothetical protein
MPTKYHILSRCLEYKTQQEGKDATSHWVSFLVGENKGGSGIDK